MYKDILAKVFDAYGRQWIIQESAHKKAEAVNQYINPEFIRNADLTTEERKKLSKLDGSSDAVIFREVHETLSPRLERSYKYNVTLKDALKKLNFKIYKKIPVKDTCDMRTMYFSFPAAMTTPQISTKEFSWLYSNGYFPHLYWNSGKPRFHPDMWFIMDFILKDARQELGIGALKSFKDWQPSFYILQQYLALMVYMYNSWNLGVAVMRYSDKTARDSGLRNQEFRNLEKSIREGLWRNEGRIIAQKILDESRHLRTNLDLIEYYRDMFALLSFGTFPSKFIIDMYRDTKRRQAVMFSYDEFTRVDVYHMGFGNVNTYHQHHLAEKYEHLFSCLDWALTMSEGRLSRKTIDVVNKYKDQRTDSNKIPCRICGELFAPKRKIDKTCGKKDCIAKNKNLSKMKRRLDDPPLAS